MLLQNDQERPQLASHSECTACFACVDACGKNALKAYMGCDGHVYIAVDENKCIGCKSCERICRASQKNYGTNQLNESQLFAAWTLNKEDRKNATSGGVFSAIARLVLEKGGVVIGACLEGRECKHILISEVDDIAKLQGSKYVVSSMQGVYKSIEKELKNRIVLFSGVGCQCAGVMAFFEKNPYRKNLITVDLVCGGAPSQILLNKFYEHFPNVEQIVSFRSKDKYELKVIEEGKIKSISGKSLPLDGFNCGMTSRFCCYDCRYAYGHRKTDLTIGDLWDYSLYPSEHRKGISMVIVHSDRANVLLEKSQITLHKIPWRRVLLKNKRIVIKHQRIFKPRLELELACKGMTYDDFLKLYCMAMTKKDFKLYIFKIYRYVRLKLDGIQNKMYIYILTRRGE